MPKTELIKSPNPADVGQNPKETYLEVPLPARRELGTPIETHKSARDRMRWAILKRISEGVYLPGERLKEMALANEFGVSQAPVREAFRELETLGILVSEHYRGTRVREISSKETRDAFQLRGYLEEVAAQLIPPEKLMEEIESIEALQAEMRTAAQTGDMDEFARANLQFHRSIVGMSSNQTLPKVWDSLEIGMRSRLNLQKNEARLFTLGEIHQPIVEALRQGDLKRTGVLLREHAFSFLDTLP